MLSLYLVPLVFINLGIISSPWLLLLLFALSGFGMSGVGMGVMHDAIHGSYSKNKKLNKLLAYTMNIIGANEAVWKVQHNALHHTYTNIKDADDDINPPFFIRFTPRAKYYWIHKFQRFYIWFFYGISTAAWVIAKDFVRLYRYRGMGFFKEPKKFQSELIKMIIWKVFYFSFAIALPIIMVPQSPWIIILGIFVMYAVSGISMSAIFQSAHINEAMEFPEPDEQNHIEDNWAHHQLSTTTNFSQNSRLFTWLIGGLNYQIEHHLLPDICHIHYRKLAPIVASTAKEYNMPYHVKRTFIEALSCHYKMLRFLGKP
ncbi:MAG TPA: fatty acid desaturase family protein [Cyclobacteriaceae bacterium]